MKKLLIGCLGLFFVLVLLAGGVVVLMDGHIEVERSAEVSATPSEVYAVVADLHTWPDWTYWSKAADPECTWDFNDQIGDGASMAWEGPTHGKGKLVLKNCAPGKGVEYDLTFYAGEAEMPSLGRIELTPAGDKTRVRWVMISDLEGLGKLFLPFMDGQVGVMFESGLTGLKTRLDG
jgi:hypothetical protein